MTVRKRCSTCKEEKPLDCFSNNKSTKDGKHSQCKACNKITAAKFRAENPDLSKEQKRKFYHKDVNKSRNSSRSQYIKHKERKMAQNKRWREAHKEVTRGIHKDWYEKNREYKLNRNAENEKLQMATNPLFRLKKNLRTRIPNALRGIIKYQGTMEYLGCSVDFLKKHLEKKFDTKMSWENYGTYWHVDHILPCSSFDLSKKVEQKRCFHYTNLQPLEASENLRKYNKILTF